MNASAVGNLRCTWRLTEQGDLVATWHLIRPDAAVAVPLARPQPPGEQRQTINIPLREMENRNEHDGRAVIQIENDVLVPAA